MRVHSRRQKWSGSSVNVDVKGREGAVFIRAKTYCRPRVADPVRVEGSGFTPYPLDPALLRTWIRQHYKHERTKTVVEILDCMGPAIRIRVRPNREYFSWKTSAIWIFSTILKYFDIHQIFLDEYTLCPKCLDYFLYTITKLSTIFNNYLSFYGVFLVHRYIWFYTT